MIRVLIEIAREGWIECVMVLVLVGTVLAGGGILTQYAYTAAFGEVITKVVVDKDSEVTGAVVGSQNGVYGQTSTNWFLVAEDGATVTVDRGEWHRVKVGEEYSSKWWR